ncbi:MAG: hypothetical protein ABI702_13620 [Burkholderiales bacterium]
MLALVAAMPLRAEPERDRIATERAAANAHFAEQERECAQRFVVTSCVEAARREQRMTLTRLHRAELALDETARREAATRRRQALNDKARVQDARASEPAGSARRTAPRAAPTANPPATAQGHAGGASSPSGDERRALEDHNKATFDAKARAAQQHREAVERRNAQRAAAGKVAAPLPVPSGASAP